MLIFRVIRLISVRNNYPTHPATSTQQSKYLKPEGLVHVTSCTLSEAACPATLPSSEAKVLDNCRSLILVGDQVSINFHLEKAVRNLIPPFTRKIWSLWAEVGEVTLKSNCDPE